MQPVYTHEAKRRIAMQLVASGQWKARDWPALAAIVRNEFLGLDETGRVVAAPEAAETVLDLWAHTQRGHARAPLRTPSGDASLS